MKKIILSGLILLAYSNIQAQEKEEPYGFNKGDITISGTINYNNLNNESFSNSNNQNYYEYKTKGNSLQLIPELAYFVSDHIMTGIKIGYIHQNSDRISNTNTEVSKFNEKTKGYNTSIFGRYYFTPQKRISFFVELDAGYSYRKSKDKSTDPSFLNTGERTSKKHSLSASPGVNLFINKKLSLTSRVGNFGYSSTKDEYKNSEGNTNNNKSNQFNARLGMSNIYFGVLYRI